MLNFLSADGADFADYDLIMRAAWMRPFAFSHPRRVTAGMDDGRGIEMRAGELFSIDPGHDSWVVGGEAYVSLHFMGAGEYARKK